MASREPRDLSREEWQQKKRANDQRIADLLVPAVKPRPETIDYVWEFELAEPVKVTDELYQDMEYTRVRVTRTMWTNPDDTDENPYVSVSGFGYKLGRTGKRVKNALPFWRLLPDVIADELHDRLERQA